MTTTLAELTATIRDINIEKGWRSATGGPGNNTWGDYVTLLHSEAAEAGEAYRDHRLEDATAWQGHDYTLTLQKPEGVGSELADTVIRLLDMADVFGFRAFPDMDLELADVAPITLDPLDPVTNILSFGDWIRWLHRVIAALGDGVGASTRSDRAPRVLRVVATIADHHGLDLTAEVNRKIEYNRTREYQHGGRTMSDTPGAPA